MMQHYSIEKWRHDHDFNIDSGESERKTRWVVILTLFMMVVEIASGSIFGSMALLADGWHMGTHVAALSISLFAYRYARQRAEDPRFSFGTGKVSALGGFSSALVLAIVALMMGAESIDRLLQPRTIHFDEAILVAVIGLLVNLLSAWLLQGGHSHGHHVDGDAHQHHDHNLRAAYLHVLADALTSLLAIVALFTGKFFGWLWMDALMGLVGAVLITRWGLALLRETSGILLDHIPDRETYEEIRRRIEADADNQVVDLHLWRLGPRHYGAIISLVTHQPRDPSAYRNLLEDMQALEHVTIEVNQCDDDRCRVG